MLPTKPPTLPFLQPAGPTAQSSRTAMHDKSGKEKGGKTAYMLQRRWEGSNLVLNLVQTADHLDATQRVDWGDDLPGAQLCGRPQGRLYAAEDEANCKSGASAHHLLRKQLHVPVVHAKLTAKSGGDRGDAGADFIAGGSYGSPDAVHHCRRLAHVTPRDPS